MSEVAVLIVFAHARQFAEFVERIWVGDVSYPLPNGHFVELMLPRNFFGSAHGLCKVGSMVHFLEFFFPAHISPLNAFCRLGPPQGALADSSRPSKSDVAECCNHCGALNGVAMNPCLAFDGHWNGSGQLQFPA